MGVRCRGECEPGPSCVEVTAADELVRRHRRAAELELSRRGQRGDFYATAVGRFQAGKGEVARNEPVGLALRGRYRLVRGGRPVVRGAIDGERSAWLGPVTGTTRCGRGNG